MYKIKLPANLIFILFLINMTANEKECSTNCMYYKYFLLIEKKKTKTKN